MEDGRGHVILEYQFTFMVTFCVFIISDECCGNWGPSSFTIIKLIKFDTRRLSILMPVLAAPWSPNSRKNAPPAPSALARHRDRLTPHLKPFDLNGIFSDLSTQRTDTIPLRMCVTQPRVPSVAIVPVMHWILSSPYCNLVWEIRGYWPLHARSAITSNKGQDHHRPNYHKISLQFLQGNLNFDQNFIKYPQ